MRDMRYPLVALIGLIALGCTPKEAPRPAPLLLATPAPKDGKPVAGPPAPPPAPISAPTPAPVLKADAAKLGPKAVTTSTGLKYEDLVVGTGPEAKNGIGIQVHYTGWLTNGTKFDSSLDRGQPYPLTLPAQVVAGWNEGIPGMKVGGKRKLVIPPALGYADEPQYRNGHLDIPANSTLVFEIELMKVE